MLREFYWVPTDKFGNWTPDNEIKMTADELDKIIDKYEGQIYRMIEGREGAMTMWACFLNHMDKGYSSAINSFRLLTNDHRSLVDREHELRHKWNQYRELQHIRYYGSSTEYYEHMVEECKRRTTRKRSVEEDKK